MLEARDRVGGRTLNHELGDGTVVEVGGQWVGPTQTRLLALAEELGRRDVPDPRRGRQRHRVARRAQALPRGDPAHQPGDPARHPARAEEARAAGADGADRGAVDGAGRAASSTARRSTPGCGARAGPAARYTLFEMGCQAVWAAEPQDVSLLHVLFYIHSAGSFDDLIGTRGRRAGAALRRRLAAHRAGDGRRGSAPSASGLSTPVRRIEHDAGGVTAVEGVRARRAIVALPPALTPRIAFAPAAARLPRPARPAHAAGHGVEVHGGLRRAVLARPTG